MRSHYFFSLSFLCLIVIVSTPSFALGKIAHQLTCQLSYDLLSKEKQLKVDTLLSTLPSAMVKRLNKYNHEKANKAITFANSCTWADLIKKDPDYEKFKAWHYVNIARDDTKVTNKTCSSNCITKAIPYHKNILTQSESPEEKREALMFLGHWIGDIHQPLHVSFSSDYGGNKNKITPFVGRCSNLHWYWDECILYPTSKHKNKPFNYDAFKHNLYQQLSLKLTNSDKRQWFSAVSSWANESLQINRDETFNYCYLEESTCKSTQNEKIIITKDYHLKYQKIIHQRILKAAVRLANVLDTSL